MPAWRGRPKVVMAGSTVEEERAAIEERRADLHQSHRTDEEREFDTKLAHYGLTQRKPRELVIVEHENGTRIEAAPFQVEGWLKKGPAWRIVGTRIDGVEEVIHFADGPVDRRSVHNAWYGSPQSTEDAQGIIDGELDREALSHRRRAKERAWLADRFGDVVDRRGR